MVSSELQRLCHLLARRVVHNVCSIISASYQCRLPAGVYTTTHSVFTLCTVWASILISLLVCLRLLDHLLRLYVDRIRKQNATDQDVDGMAKRQSRPHRGKPPIATTHVVHTPTNCLNRRLADKLLAASTSILVAIAASWRITLRPHCLITDTDDITFVHAFWSCTLCCWQFHYQLLYLEIQVKCPVTFPLSTVNDRCRRRATWQPLSGRHQLASHQMQLQATIERRTVIWIDVLPSLVVLILVTNIVTLATALTLPWQLCIRAWKRRPFLGSPGSLAVAWMDRRSTDARPGRVDEALL